MSPRRLAWAPAMLLLAGVAAPAAAADAPQYERPQNQTLSDVVPPDVARGPHYRIGSTVLYDGYMNHYSVESDYGSFEVTGDVALWKLLREIAAITALRATKETAAYRQAVETAAKAPLGLAEHLLLHPVDTVTGVPRGMFQIMEDAAAGATAGANPSEDARIKQALTFSSWKRGYAYRAGVDPYSGNRALQKDLNQVAWAATLGDWSESAALLPEGSAAIAVSATRTAESVRRMLKEEPPQRLRALNDAKLRAIGVPDSLRTQFLDHPVYTPTSTTWIAETLAGLGKIPGVDAVLRQAVTATDEVEVGFYVNVAQILRAYHAASPLRGIQSVNRRLIVAQAASGAAVVPAPVDRLIWTARVDEVSRSLKARYRAPGFKGRIELWTTGAISEMAQRELTRRGIIPFEKLGYRLQIHE